MISYHIIRYHIISYDIISYRTISYHIIRYDDARKLPFGALQSYVLSLVFINRNSSAMIADAVTRPSGIVPIAYDL